MKINLNIKTANYAKCVAEFLYKLHPVVLKDEVEFKKKFGKILGYIHLNYSDYDKREQFANLYSDKNVTVKKYSFNYNIPEELKKIEKDEILDSQRKDFINLEFYIEVEDRQYGRMLSEFFDNLTEDFLEQAVFRKRQKDKLATLISKYLGGYKITKEEYKLIAKYLEDGDIKTKEN